MAQNMSPIYTLNALATWGQVTAADTGVTGTGANVVLVHTSGSNGSFVNKLIFQPLSTSGSTTTSAAAARIYINNGSAVSSATNNNLFKEITLVAIAVNPAATIGANGLEVGLGIQLPAGYCIYVGITAIAANTQWNVQNVSGNY
jgi:hypothetical protein